MDVRSRAALLRAVRDKANPHAAAQTARWFLERTDPQLAPPSQRVTVDWRIELVNRLEELPVETLDAIIEADTEDEVYALLEGGGDDDGQA
jgi:hypothetical protein